MSDPSRRLRRHFTAASQRRFQRDGKRGGAYVARASGRHYCLGETSVLAESSDVYGVLQSSQVLLQVHGAKNACHYQASGWMMQRFGALAAQRRIGGCILGVTPAEDTLCSMAIGYARAEDEPAFDVPALTVSMTQAIRRHLARRLPDYMLPQHITLIPEIPCPTTVRSIHHACRKSSSTANVWLRAAMMRYGCADFGRSFWTSVKSESVVTKAFSLKGNSLLAMRLVRKISLATGTEMRLEDLYNNNTIQEMAAWVAGQPCGNGREEGAL